MHSEKHNAFYLPPIAGENNADYRRRAEEVQAEAAQRRQQQIDQQSSPLNSPSARIQLWEQLHQVDLPRNPEHRLVEVIAANTGLTVSEVRAEQLGRTVVVK
jgi:hypothetical protein